MEEETYELSLQAEHLEGVLSNKLAEFLQSDVIYSIRRVLVAELKYIYVGPDTGMAAKTQLFVLYFYRITQTQVCQQKIGYLYCISIVLPKRRYGSKTQLFLLYFYCITQTQVWQQKIGYLYCISFVLPKHRYGSKTHLFVLYLYCITQTQVWQQKLDYLYCISIVLPKHRYGSKKSAICIVFLLCYPNTGMAAKT